MRCANYELFVRRRRVNSRVRSPYRRRKVLPAAAAAVHSLSHRHAPNKKLRFLVKILRDDAKRTVNTAFVCRGLYLLQIFACIHHSPNNLPSAVNERASCMCDSSRNESERTI